MAHFSHYPPKSINRRCEVQKTFNIACIAIAVALSGKPAAAIQPVIFYNSHTNMCLQPAYGSETLGTLIVQEPCNGSAAQEWLYISVGSAGFHFENALSGFCLEARGGPGNGTPIQQWTCNNLTNENWQSEVGPKGVGAPLISGDGHSDSYCLDIPGGQQTAGLAMQLYSCNGTVSQLWQLLPDGALVIPNVLGFSDIAAVGQVTLYDLKPVVMNSNRCISPGAVTGEYPPPGTTEAPNSPVYLYVDSDCFK